MKDGFLLKPPEIKNQKILNKKIQKDFIDLLSLINII